MDPLLSVIDVRSLEQRFVASVGPTRFNTLLFGSFALIGIVLALSGVYGVTSYVVAQRTHEIGVRMALGAKATTVRHTVALGAVKLAAVGLAIGLTAAFGLTRLLSDLLFEISPLDATTFAASVVAFASVAWLGSYLPARRASGVDPLVALRAE